MGRFRRHLTYANVLSTLAALLVLTGGVAYAAGHLAKNSVGAKQLKKSSVTNAKLKRNAVSTAKIRKDAVAGAKVKPASLTDADLAPGMPFTHIAQEFRASTAVALPPTTPTLVPYPLPATYTQEAGRIDQYVGFLDVSIAPTCVNPEVVAVLLADAGNVTEPTPTLLSSVVAVGVFSETGSAQRNVRINLGPYAAGGARVGPTGGEIHTLTLALSPKCSSGEGITATAAGVDVIGTR
jgi:hypothetical protein